MFEIFFISMILNFYFMYKHFCSHIKWEGVSFILFTITLHMSIIHSLVYHFDHVTYTHCQGKEISTSVSAALSMNKMWAFCFVLSLGVYLEKSVIICAEFISCMLFVYTSVDYNYNMHVIFTIAATFFAIIKKIVYYDPSLRQINRINYASCIIMVISFINHNIYKCGDYTYSIFCFAELLWMQTNIYWNYKRRAIMNIKRNKIKRVL